MPPPRKPRLHPRSLDALFPKPKVRRCPRGHSQTPEWRTISGCSTCRKQDAEEAERARLSAGGGAEERERWRAELGPPPAVMVLRSFDGRSTQTFHPGPRRARRR